MVLMFFNWFLKKIICKNCSYKERCKKLNEEIEKTLKKIEVLEKYHSYHDLETNKEILNILGKIKK